MVGRKIGLLKIFTPNSYKSKPETRKWQRLLVSGFSSCLTMKLDLIRNTLVFAGSKNQPSTSSGSSRPSASQLLNTRKQKNTLRGDNEARPAVKEKTDQSKNPTQKIPSVAASSSRQPGGPSEKASTAAQCKTGSQASTSGAPTHNSQQDSPGN